MNSYQEYLYYLLHVPFKKVKKEVNQWKILMQVLGKYMDEVKEYIFLIREETSLDTAQKSVSLDVIAAGMRMYRYNHEKDESFRKRLLAKRAIAEIAGTKRGIIYALTALGYKDSEIVPIHELYGEKNCWDGKIHFDGHHIWTSTAFLQERWAEFLVKLNLSSEDYDFEILKNEIRRVKQGSSLPVYHFQIRFDTRTKMNLSSITIELSFQTKLDILATPIIEIKFTTQTQITAGTFLEGTWNGAYSFNGVIKFNRGMNRLEEM